MEHIDSVGLTTLPEKSIILPTPCIEFVGFLLNSLVITVKQVPRKVADLKEQEIETLKAKELSIRELLKLIGIMVAAEIWG